MRQSLRASPDHHVARAGDLLAQPDPLQLFEFVRDQIATYPGGAFNTDPIRATRWGTRGTLRGGAGTPREKAELLADLYRRAGWEAEVLQASGSMPPEAVKQLLWRAPDRPFAPEITTRQMTQWRKRLGLPADTEEKLPRIDQGGGESRKLARSLEQALPPKRIHIPNFDWRWGGTPVVRLEANGQSLYANLFNPDVPFGEAGVKPSGLRAARDLVEPPTVEVTLSTALASAPTDRMDLVTGTWPLEDLVGRQVIVQMLPGLDLRRLAASTFRDVHTFIPALSVQGFDLDAAAMGSMSVLGDPISRQGERIEISEEGAVSLNGRPLATPDQRPSIDTVDALEIEIDSSLYPTIRFDAEARNSAGAAIQGLIASDFRVEENGRSAGFVLSANRAAPRIMFLSDASGSMPPEYRGKGMEELVADLTGRIKAEHPHAAVRGQATSSELWRWLTWAAGQDSNLIIYATDGHVADEPTDEMRAILANAPPLVIINVRGYDEDNFWYKRTFAPMLEAAEGSIVAATETEEAHAAILGYLREFAATLPTYHFRYGAPSDQAGERTVVLSTVDGRVSTKATYVAPASTSPISDLSGLYLTVKVGRESVTRTLAGYDPALHGAVVVTREMLDQTLGACFGSHFISFEAAAPSFSIWLDDFLGAKLSVAPLDQALRENRNVDELEAVLQQGVLTLPPELLLQALPIEDAVTDRSLTFEDGPRVLLYGSHPVFGQSHYVRRVDVLPFTSFATAAEESDEAFRITLEKTARIAIAEAALFPVSTHSLLANESLVDDRTLLTGLPLERRAQWSRWIRTLQSRNYKLVPADAEPLALWNIDFRTGTMLGILPDGSGGGSAEERIAKQLEQIDQVMAFYNMLLGQMAAAAAVPTPGGVALGIVAAYGQLLTRLYAAASLAITIMDASGIEDSVSAALQQFACNVKKTIFTAAFGGLGEAFSGLDYLIGAIGGDDNNPFAC